MHGLSPRPGRIAESAIITIPMPSPIGHALAGVAVALVAERLRRPSGRPAQRPWPSLVPLVAIGAVVAALPDADLLLPDPPGVDAQRGATALVMIVAAAVTGWVTRHPKFQAASHDSVGSRQSVASRPAVRGPTSRHVVWTLALVCGAAHASHILLDWLGADSYSPRGIQALWPFSDGWFISGWDVFARVERRNPLSWPAMIANLKAGVREVALMAPVAAGAWWLARGRAAFRRAARN